MKEYPLISRMGERAFLIQFEPEISEKLLEKVQALKKLLQIKLLEPKLEITTTYNSLLISYNYTIENPYGEFIKLKSIISSPKEDIKNDSQLFSLPVCYDQKFAPDLELISEQKKLTTEEIICRHSDPVYTVYFIGFLPGFLYLGGLDPKLYISRKEKPRPRILKGAVGIGEQQTGIYPRESPGGWQIIGNCPVNLFNKDSVPPCSINAGDHLKFYPVNLEEYEHISKKVQEGSYSIKTESYDRRS